MSDETLIPKSPKYEGEKIEHFSVDDDQGEVFGGADPIAQFKDWLALARQKEPNDPNAMALATVDQDGMPDVRMVLLKEVSESGLTFYTNLESAKGEQLAHHPHAALCFHWKTIRRQVRFRGAVERVSDDEADAYFASRDRGARIGAWASAQSRMMEGPLALQREVAKYTAKYGLGSVPRPPHWSGFRLQPTQIEFWVNRPFRLHERKLFSRANLGSNWGEERLFP